MGESREPPWRGDESRRQALLEEMAALRDEIDRIDDRLVELLNRRAASALAIGEVKRTLAMEIYQPSREEAVLKHVRGVNTGPLDGDAIARLFERIIDEARRLERAVAAPTEDGRDARP